ncbi:MAG: IclR family transcriptional regulator [Acidobacteriota bacterium]
MVTAKKKGAKPKRTQVDKNYISVTAKILAVLEYFVREGAKHQSVSFQELASSLPFARTTVHRVLYSLEKLGYVEKAEVKAHYLLGPKFFELTNSATHYRRLQSVAKAVMLELMVRYSETVNLGVIDEGQVVYLDVLQSPSSLRIAANPGDRNPVHSTALGKAITAFLPEKELAAMLDLYPMVKMTGKTITQRAQLLQHLSSVREQGVAFDLGENLDGVICVAAPIFDPEGRAIAGLSVSGPTSRMEPKLLVVRDDVKDSALRISRMLAPLSALRGSPANPRSSVPSQTQ